MRFRWFRKACKPKIFILQSLQSSTGIPYESLHEQPAIAKFLSKEFQSLRVLFGVLHLLELYSVIRSSLCCCPKAIFISLNCVLDQVGAKLKWCTADSKKVALCQPAMPNMVKEPKRASPETRPKAVRAPMMILVDLHILSPTTSFSSWQHNCFFSAPSSIQMFVRVCARVPACARVQEVVERPLCSPALASLSQHLRGRLLWAQTRFASHRDQGVLRPGRVHQADEVLLLWHTRVLACNGNNQCVVGRWRVVRAVGTSR